MRVSRDEEVKVQVQVKTARRAKPGEKNSKGKPIPQGSMIYETLDTIDIFEATAEEVYGVVKSAIDRASQTGAERPAATAARR